MIKFAMILLFVAGIFYIFSLCLQKILDWKINLQYMNRLEEAENRLYNLETRLINVEDVLTAHLKQTLNDHDLPIKGFDERSIH